MSTGKNEFKPNMFGIRPNGVAMPGRFVRFESDGAAVLASPTGREYAFPPERLESVESVMARLEAARLATVLEGYRFETISRRPVVVKVWNPRRPRKAPYVVTQGWHGQYFCTCAAFEKSDEDGCKHCRAVAILQAEAAQQEAA